MESKWIEEDREVLKMLKEMNERELLVLVAEYEKKDRMDFIVEVVFRELSYYTDDLRFARWVKKRYLNVTDNS